MTNTISEKNLTVLFVDLISQDLKKKKKKSTTNVIKIRSRLIAWSVEKMLKILTQNVSKRMKMWISFY